MRFISVVDAYTKDNMLINIDSIVYCKPFDNKGERTVIVVNVGDSIVVNNSYDSIVTALRQR